LATVLAHAVGIVTMIVARAVATGYRGHGDPGDHSDVVYRADSHSNSV